MKTKLLINNTGSGENNPILRNVRKKITLEAIKSIRYGGSFTFPRKRTCWGGFHMIQVRTQMDTTE
jgi:hypothetical protein